MPKFEKKKPSFKSDGKGSKYGKVQGDASMTSGSSSVGSTSFNPLMLHFIPGTEGAGRIAATTKAGLSETGWDGGVTSTYFSMSIPTVALVEWSPTMGNLFSDIGKSTVNAAIFKVYNYIRSRNASVAAYSPNDILFALEAMSGIAILFAKLRKRLQILCSAGSQITNAYPEGMMEIHGLTVVDRDNLASYIVKYNQLVELSKSLVMPKFYKLFARRSALASTIYLDDPIISKSQLISMEPTCYYLWDLDPASATVGQLRSVTSTATTSISLIFSALESALSMYMLDADMNNIYAEIRKAFGDSEVYSFQPFPTDGERLQVVYDQVLLDQLHNANIVGDISPTYNLSVKEDTTTGFIVYQNGDVQISNSIKYSGSDVDFCFLKNHGTSQAAGMNPSGIKVYAHDDQPDEESTANLCHWKVVVKSLGPNISITTMGTEIINCVSIISREWPYGATSGASSVVLRKYYLHNVVFGSVGVSGMFNISTGAKAYETFGYLPVIQHSLQTVESGGTPLATYYKLLEGDVDNRYPVAATAIEQLHCATLAWLVACE